MMMAIKASLLLMIISSFTLLLQLLLIVEGKCPSKANSFCLQVDGFDSILLDGSHFTNISKVFRQIAFLFDDDHESKELDQFILINNHKLEKLDRNVFCDFRFRHIVIRNCTRLNRIDRDAFNGTARFLKSIKIDFIGLTESSSEDFFEALNSLDNLEDLELKNHRVLNITEYTFRQKRLKSLHLDGPLEVLNNNAFFYTDNLSILKLTKSIRRIKQHAFHFRLASNKTLDLYLDAKIGSMERRVFLSTQRPLTINLFLNKMSNFEAAIFRPVLMEPIKHELILHGNPKEMRNPCQLLWLFRNKHRFKGVFQFKDEPMINESYFDQWRCSNQMIHGHPSSSGGTIVMDNGQTNINHDNEIHEEMNNIDRAGIDASHNSQALSPFINSPISFAHIIIIIITAIRLLFSQT
ncbi:hypothetical protein BLA29_000777 [Euroglyphus maynei]|uniref:Leucine rich repeat containing protein n=1 Tax=Euroglyphus maynei TaxID=6958 RepID=A0A1Y3B124_EURMA|nr:hypothetical protein BLA29_000777 [Euroglyphus maynei]